MIEAKCTLCHEIFNPDSEADIIHWMKGPDSATECLGIGVILGEWVL